MSAERCVADFDTALAEYRRLRSVEQAMCSSDHEETDAWQNAFDALCDGTTDAYYAMMEIPVSDATGVVAKLMATNDLFDLPMFGIRRPAWSQMIAEIGALADPQS